MSEHTGDDSPSIEPGVRRWRAVRGLFVVVAVLAGAAMLAMVISSTAGASWSMHEASWGAVLVVCLVVTVAFSIFANVAGGKARDASFARAHRSTGTVADVTEMPARGDYSGYYVVTLEASLPGGGTLRRHFDTGGGPQLVGRVGRQVPFRHRTLDPDDLEDVLIGLDGFHALHGDEEQ